MKKSFLAFAAASLLLTTACSNQDELLQDNQGNGQTINLTLEATRGGDAQATRTAITYNNEYASLESVWSLGDVIYVYSRRSGEQIGTLTQSGDIINQKSSSTSQYPTSYATFSGSVTLGADDVITDDYAFVYKGTGSPTFADGKLTYTMGTSTTIAGLSAWDLAYATGKIQGTAASASCAVSFTNKMAFGYFTTEGFSSLSAQYYSSFTFDVKTGTVTGQSGAFSLPDNKKFYMPLVPGTVNMDCGKSWSQQDGKWGYGATKQSKSFTASAGSYYRLGRNASDPFGPVAFESTDWTLYETLKNSKFSVSASKEVYFTQGNLQYIGSAATPYWRIAPDQYSYLGSANGKPSSTDSGSKIAADTDVDLFGWGEVTPPFLGSTVSADYQPGITASNVNLTTDWATKFENGTTLYAEAGKVYPKNGTTYCCLTKDEWQYLFDNQYWGYATVSLTDGDTKIGIVICPNTVTTEDAAKAFLTGTVYKSSTNQGGKSDAFTENYITQATIDANGLLFLPAAGYRSGSTIGRAGENGGYWSATSNSATDAYLVHFGTAYAIINTGFYSATSNGRYRGFSVRLACLAN